MTIWDILSKAPTSLILGVLAILALLVCLLPIALKIAGLTGAQIVDLMSMTMQFFVNMAKELRDQNKQ